MVHSLPALSATISSSPIGVCRRSTSRVRGSTMVGHPEMLMSVGVPRPPSGRGIVLYDSHGLALPVARGTQARALPDQRRELGVARKMAVDGGDVGAEIEH